MASVPRIIATGSRMPSIRSSISQITSYRKLYASIGAKSLSLNYVKQPSTKNVGKILARSDDFNTARHTTNPHRSRDIRPVAHSSGSLSIWHRDETQRVGGARYFTTGSSRYNASERDGVQRTSDQVKSASDTTTPSESPTDKPVKVPQILKSLTPPVATHENIYTLPNFLTTTRVITAPCISYALLHAQPVLAFTLFAYSSITDLVDGWLARRYNSGTVLGSILDPFADKLLMTLTTISLYSIGTFPWWLALIILGRDAGLLLSALYFRWISLPPPRTMTRYWDFSLPSAEVRPTEISKINTMLQFLLVADAVLLPVLPVGLVETWNLWGILEGWMGLVAGTTVWSGLSYVFTKDAIRFIGSNRNGAKKTAEESEEEVTEQKK